MKSLSCPLLGASMVLSTLLGGCSHHAAHHARGETHSHQALYVAETHPEATEQHGANSAPDSWHDH